MAHRHVLNSGLLAAAASLALVACPLDNRSLAPYAIQWFEGGAAGDDWGQDEAGAGGKADSAGQGGESGETGGAGKGSSGAGGKGGSGGSSLGDAGAGGQPDDCPDLDGDEKPDCDQTLVSNGSFDADASGWDVQPDVLANWAQNDADNRPSSGSMNVVNEHVFDSDQITMAGAYQCVPLEPGRYTFVGQVLVGAGQTTDIDGGAGVNLLLHGLPGCAGTPLSNLTRLASPSNQWQVVSLEEDIPFEVKSVAVRLVVTKPYRAERFEAHFDNVLFVKHASTR